MEARGLGRFDDEFHSEPGTEFDPNADSDVSEDLDVEE